MGYNPISNRILTVRIAAKPWNLTLIQVYAPTNQATDGEKRALIPVYKRYLARHRNRMYIVLLCGDYDAKIGEGASIGKFALGVRNDNGERLVQFAQVNDLVAANAMMNQHPRHQYTTLGALPEELTVIKSITFCSRRDGCQVLGNVRRVRKLMQTQITRSYE